MKPLTPHPDWCARDHQCTAAYPTGEHASRPETWRLPYGRLVAARHQAVDGRDWLELRTAITLPAAEPSAQATARLLIAATHHTLTRTLHGHDLKGHLR